LRAPANAGLVGDVVGARAVEHRVGGNFSVDVSGFEFFQHDVAQFDIEAADLNSAFGLTIRAGRCVDPSGSS